MDVVCLEFVHIGRIASQLVVVVANHHGHLDARPGNSELIENRLVRVDYVFKLFDSVHESQLPEPKRVSNDEQLGVGTFLFQAFQKCDELGGVVAMLQSAVAAHVQVADEVIFLCQVRGSLPSASIALSAQRFH